MKVRMRAIAVILAIAMSAWVSFEAHAGGKAEAAHNRPRQRSQEKFTSSRRSRTGSITPRPVVRWPPRNHPIIINDRDAFLVMMGPRPLPRGRCSRI